MNKERELFYKSFYGQENLTKDEIKTLNESEYHVLEEFYHKHHFKFDKEIDSLVKGSKVSHRISRHSLHDFYTELLHAVEDHFGLAEYNSSKQNYRNANPTNIVTFVKNYISKNTQLSDHQKQDLYDYFDSKLKHQVGSLIHLLIFLAMDGRR